MADKKLYRNPDDSVLCGVCSGLAKFFEVDVTLVRVLFLLGTLFGAGATLVAYLVLLCVMPIEPKS
jgi:phage shock protein PspC (stress-responsive transcriptional regulator)